MKKKCFALLMMSLFIIFSITPVWARDGQFIYDEAGVLKNDELDRLNEYAQDVKEKIALEVYFVLSRDLQGQNTNDYANNIFHEVKESDNAFLFLVDESTGTYACLASGYGQDYNNDEKIKEMLDAYNNEHSYYDAIISIYDVFLNTEIEVDPNLPSERLKSLFYDEVGLLSVDEAIELENLLEAISKRNACEVAVAVVESLNGQSALDRAADFYDYNGYGYGSNDDGILLLVSMNEREYATVTYGYGIEAFTDLGLIYLEDEFLDELANGEYADAFEEYASAADELLQMAKDGKIYGESHSVKKETSIFSMLRMGMAALVGVLVSFISTSSMKSELKTVKKQIGASQYVTNNHFNLRNNYDFFTHRHISRQKIERSDSSGGSSSGRSTFRSSSGRVHGGRSGKF